MNKDSFLSIQELSDLRIQAQIPLVQAAEFLHIGETSLSAYERGIREIPQDIYMGYQIFIQRVIDGEIKSTAKCKNLVRRPESTQCRLRNRQVQNARRSLQRCKGLPEKGTTGTDFRKG